MKILFAMVIFLFIYLISILDATFSGLKEATHSDKEKVTIYLLSELKKVLN